MWNDRFTGSRFGMRGVAYDPLTIAGAALTLGGGAITAMGTIAGGKASQTAGFMQAAAARTAGESALEVANLTAEASYAAGAAGFDASMRQSQAFEFKALQEDQNADLSRAEGQRAAFERRREGKLLDSALVARAAKDGGGADPSTINVRAQLSERTEYTALMEMFKGENTARSWEDSAIASRMGGEASRAEAYGRLDEAMYRGKIAIKQGAAGYMQSVAQANSSIFAGNAARDASKISAVGTIIGSAGSAMRFGMGTGSGGNPSSLLYGPNPFTPYGGINPAYR